MSEITFDDTSANGKLSGDLGLRRNSFRICRLAGHDMAAIGRQSLGEIMVVDCLSARSGGQQPKLVFDVNGQGIALREKDPEYKRAVDSADIIHSDGAFLVFISKIFTSTPIKERSATTDLLHDFAKIASEHDLSFYILGGEERVNNACEQRLRELYPLLRIVGRRNGYFTEDQEEELFEHISSAKPDVIWVGLGKPLEQVFSLKLRQRVNCGWIVTCGGCFNFVTGAYKRAPIWMQKVGIEWLYRAFTSWRLFKRYLVTNPQAIWVICRELIKGNPRDENLPN